MMFLPAVIKLSSAKGKWKFSLFFAIAIIIETVSVVASDRLPSWPIPAKRASESFHSLIWALAGQIPLLPQGICILPPATLSSVRYLEVTLFLWKPLEWRRKRGVVLLRHCRI